MDGKKYFAVSVLKITAVALERPALEIPDVHRCMTSVEEDPDSRLLAAHALSRNLGVSFYDALYVALAQELGFRFVTADAELYHRARRDLPYVAWIGDLPA